MTRRHIAIALAIACATVAFRAPLWDVPLERDEGGYAYVAWRLAHGEMPYLDWFEQKPPGVFLAYALGLALPGPPEAGIRAVAAFAVAAAAFGVYAIALALFGALAAPVAALLFALACSDPLIQGSIANAELFMLPGFVGGTALALRLPALRPLPAVRCIAIGVLLGLSLAFKPVVALNIPFLWIAFALGDEGPDRAARTARFMAWMGVGGVLAWLPIVAWLAAKGALAAAFEVGVLHNLQYAAQVPWSVRPMLLWHNTRGMLGSQGPLWLLALGGTAWLVWRRRSGAAAFVAGWALANAAGVAASGLFFTHYFQQLLPPVAVAASAAAAAGLAQAEWRSPRGLALGLLAALPLVYSSFVFWRYTPAELFQRLYPGAAFEAIDAFTHEVARRTGPDDRIFVFGAEPQILFEAQRVSASRFIYLYPLFGEYAGLEAKQRALIAEVEAARPAMVAWLPNRMTSDGRGLLDAWFGRFAAEHYRLHGVLVRSETSRGDFVRADDPSLAQRTAGERPWGMLFERKDR